MTRVSGEEVEYIGWKSYGRLTQLVPVGSYCTWPKPLSALAVIDPVAPVVRSLMTARSPCRVSPMDTLMLSPEFISRSRFRSGVNVAVVDCTGLAGAVVRPSLLRNAKLTYSVPVMARHVGFSSCPVTGFSARLKMFIAAHHLVGSQPLAPTATCQVGHGIHPGGYSCSSTNAVPEWLGETAGSRMLLSLSGVQVDTCSG